MTAAPRLAGRVALVTGGSLGIGAATARRLCAEGGRVVLVARRPEPAQPLLQELGDAARFVAGDVALPQTAAAAVAAAEQHFGRLDILVNNAALDFVRPVAETSLQEARQVLDVNFLGAFLMLQAALPGLRRAGGGAVVNVISRYALVGGPGMGIYGAAKGALLSLTRAAAIEWAPDGIRVNAVAPGPTETPLLEAALREEPDPAAARRQWEQSLPLGRLGTAADVAAAVAFLVSDDARQITGACLSVDGGYTAR